MDNKIGSALKTIGWLILAVGSVGAFAIGGMGSSLILFLACVFVSVIFGLFMVGIGEIVCILDDNRKYLSILTKTAPEARFSVQEKMSNELPDL